MTESNTGTIRINAHIYADLKLYCDTYGYKVKAITEYAVVKWLMADERAPRPKYKYVK